MSRLFLGFLVAVLVAPALAGCVGFQRAEVPERFLTDGWRAVDQGEGRAWYGLAARWAHVTYEVTPRQNVLGSGPYPATLQVLSVNTASRLDRAEVLANLEQQVRDNAAAQSVTLHDRTRVSGERTLQSGVRSEYFTYEARVAAGSLLFQSGQAARVLGEVFYHEPSGVTVVVVALAQVQGSGPTGGQFTDHRNWDRIVMDPRGSIEGRTGESGLVYNVRMGSS